MWKSLLRKYIKHVEWRPYGAVCALWWCVFVLAWHKPQCLCVHALYGVAAALRHAIGSRADCFACRLFFRPFVVSFSEPPAPPTQPSAPLLSHVDAHNTHRLKTLLIELYTSFTVAFFGQIVVPPPPYQYRLTVHTTKAYCIKADAPT